MEIKCKSCGNKVQETDNFCGFCGTKLKEICDCWVKKGNYNCGEKNCPGYRLFLMEKLKSN